MRIFHPRVQRPSTGPPFAVPANGRPGFNHGRSDPPPGTKIREDTAGSASRPGSPSWRNREPIRGERSGLAAGTSSRVDKARRIHLAGIQNRSGRCATFVARSGRERHRRRKVDTARRTHPGGTPDRIGRHGGWEPQERRAGTADTRRLRCTPLRSAHPAGNPGPWSMIGEAVHEERSGRSRSTRNREDTSGSTRPAGTPRPCCMRATLARDTRRRWRQGTFPQRPGPPRASDPGTYTRPGNPWRIRRFLEEATHTAGKHTLHHTAALPRGMRWGTCCTSCPDHNPCPFYSR